MDGSRSSRSEKGKEIIDCKGKQILEEEEGEEEEEAVNEAWEFLKKDETQQGRRILTEEEENEVWAILEDDNYKGRWIVPEEEEKEMMKMELEREMVEMMQNLDIIKEGEMCRQIFDKYFGKDVMVATDEYLHSLARIVTDHSHSLLERQQQQLLEQQQQRARAILDFGDVSPHLAMRHQLEEIHQDDARNAEEEKADDARSGKEEEEADDAKNAEEEEEEADDAKNADEEADDAKNAEEEEEGGDDAEQNPPKK